jgi:hypothetical protein
LQVGVALAIGVLVTSEVGIGVIVLMGGTVGVSVIIGVALRSASTVCAAEVALASCGSLDGRLQAPKNKAMMTNKLNRRMFFFIFSPSFTIILPQDGFVKIPRRSYLKQNRSLETPVLLDQVRAEGEAIFRQFRRARLPSTSQVVRGRLILHPRS